MILRLSYSSVIFAGAFMSLASVRRMLPGYPPRMTTEPKFRHPDCPDVHLGVCAKCRRLYERDASDMGDKDVPEMRGHGSVPAGDSSSASGVTASGASHRLRPRQRADDASLTSDEATEPAGRSSSEGRRGKSQTRNAASQGSPTPGVAGVASGPLTPAEKQRAYRERLKADPERYKEYLAKERARKR